jgi:hypothetical protein
MPTPADSFKQFDYSLRPSKQVERKMMIEILLRLARAEYLISDYRYVGFGSVYYVDFVMFHKFLFMEDMTCVEWSRIPKRMKFNKPFRFIDLHLQPLSLYIPAMNANRKYFAWFDYDRALDPDMLQDIDGSLIRMAAGSIFIVTVDARPKLPKDLFPNDDLDAMTAVEREEFTATAYKEWFGPYREEEITEADISGPHVAPLFYETIRARITETLSSRGMIFIQLFNYIYKDGAPMLTVGGMIGTSEDQRRLRSAGILGHRFVRRQTQPLKISVPPLTLREKYWLDSRLDNNLTPARLIFELESELLRNYKSFYREYPTYMETML